MKIFHRVSDFLFQMLNFVAERSIQPNDREEIVRFVNDELQIWNPYSRYVSSKQSMRLPYRSLSTLSLLLILSAALNESGAALAAS